MTAISSMSNVKKILLSLIVLGFVSGILGAGTFASFSAQTTNDGNTFSTGTLVLSNKKTGATACLSTGGGSTDTNNNANCDQLINSTVAKPGDSASQTLTLKNEGSLDGSALKLFSAACANADNSESYHGTGNPCSKVQLYIQQYADAAFAVPTACLYGGATVPTICDFSDTTKTLAAFQSSYNSPSNGVTVASALDSGDSVYVKIAVQLPTSADNTFQGRKATMDFSWYVAQ